MMKIITTCFAEVMCSSIMRRSPLEKRNEEIKVRCKVCLVTLCCLNPSLGKEVIKSLSIYFPQHRAGCSVPQLLNASSCGGPGPSASTGPEPSAWPSSDGLHKAVGSRAASTNPFYLQKLPVKENYAHQRDSLKAPLIN